MAYTWFLCTKKTQHLNLNVFVLWGVCMWVLGSMRQDPHPMARLWCYDNIILLDEGFVAIIDRIDINNMFGLRDFTSRYAPFVDYRSVHVHAPVQNGALQLSFEENWGTTCSPLCCRFLLFEILQHSIRGKLGVANNYRDSDGILIIIFHIWYCIIVLFLFCPQQLSVAECILINWIFPSWEAVAS